MIKYFAIILLGFCSILSSCREAQEKPSTQQLLKEIEETKLRASEQDDQIVFWKNMLQQERYASDRVAKASINYQIAKNFSPISLDSAEAYMTKGLILIEDVEEFEKEKLSIYNGLGVIADRRGKNALSSFYYNKVISIVDANPSISTISAKRKVRYYLHSAQSNEYIGLHETAFDLCKKAERYVDSLPKDDYLRFRVYAQLYSSGAHKKIGLDSLRYYLEKTAQHSHSDSDESKQIYYARKAHFFKYNKQFDSSRIYLQKKLELSVNMLKNEETKSSKNSIHSQNIYIAYCDLLQNSIYRRKIGEADSTITKLKKIEAQISDQLTPMHYVHFNKIMMNYYYYIKDFEKYYQVTEKVLVLTEQVKKEAELQAKEEMHTMYQLEENKKSIKELNQSVEVTENELQKTKYFLAITILAILVILGILAILYYRQKTRKLQQEYEKVILEQKLLRTQMEPHFIFNTLSTLQSLIRFQEPKKAIDYLNRFSRLLRSNLELSRQEMISLEDEIETMDNYLGLQQARFEDYFTYQIQVPDELEVDALFIPPMLIQPFVENSILHGFDGEKEWHIDIKITELAETKQLQIEIIDNGVGINTIPKKNHKSLSGEIAKERLEILSKKYKIPTDYQIFSEQGKGTTVCLKLPIINGFQQN
ncbi:histidine kinase [Bernardetia sp. Wsw4-3y2]|uniref:sensor histidine kinase n=1 Tax=Bernardetia sp. Wsw4-3y2 TaxID=3127471 RepID=UPI0030D2EBFA